MRRGDKSGRTSCVRPFLLVLACFGLTACESGSGGGRASIQGDTPPLVLSGEGLLAGNTGLEVGFGRAFDGAVAAVNALARETPMQSDRIEGCRAADVLVTYRSGLELYFQQGSLEGWRVEGDAPYATADGVKLGQAHSGTASRGIGVVLDASGRVTALSAGASCDAG